MPDTVTISSGSKTLSKGTSDSYIVKGSGLLIVSSGGSFLGSRPEINAYGSMWISSGGKANPLVGSGGLLDVYSNGYVYDVRVSSGGKVGVYRSATCSGMTVSPGGSVIVRGGNLLSANISSANLTLESVDSPGYSYAADITLGGNAVMTLQSGARTRMTTLKESAELIIRHGGYASSNTVSSGATLDLFGSARDNTVSNGAYMFVFSGGEAYGNYVSRGGLLRVYESGSASSNFVSSSGVMDVFSGGRASGTTVFSGGSLYVGNQATVSQTVLSGGSVTLYGRSENGVYSAGVVTVSSGAFSYAETFYCSAIVEGVAGSSGTVERATLGAGATVQVWGGRLEGRTVGNATVNLISGYVGLSSVGGLVAMVKDGTFWVSSGAMNSASVNNGGKLYMMQGATANLVNVSSGGHCGVASGCIVSSANVGALAGSNRGTIGISSGGQLVKGNISGTVEVGLGGRATSVTVTFGGSAVVKGIVDSTVVSSGTLLVSSGGTVKTGEILGSATIRQGASAGTLSCISGGSATIVQGASAGTLSCISGGSASISGTVDYVMVSSGSAKVFSGATVSSATVSQGGRLMVGPSGAACFAKVFSRGSATISSGGLMKSSYVSSGGSVVVSSGGALSSTTVGSGGTLIASTGAVFDGNTVGSKGRVTGRYVCSGLTFATGAIADFDITAVDPGGANVLVRDLYYPMNRGVVFTLTVNTSQKRGTYKLADGAAYFSETITIQSPIGVSYGKLTVGQTATVNGSVYSLSEKDGVLSVQVSEAAPASAKSDVNANGVSDVMFQYIGGQGQIGFWMDGTSTWQSTNSTHPTDVWDVLGAYDMNANGKADAVLVGNTEISGIKGAFIGYYTDAQDYDSNWVNISYLTNYEGYVWKNKVGNLTGNAGMNSIVWHCTEIGALGVWTDGTDSWISLGAGYDSNWTLVGCGDFNGDGKDAVVMSYLGGVKYYTVGIDGVASELATSGSGWEVRAIGDFAGDGRDDIIVFHKETGIVAKWNNGDSSSWLPLGQLDPEDWFVAGAGDYDGDGKDDLLVRQNTTGMLGYYSGGDMNKWTELGRGVDMSWTVIA